MKEDHQLTRDSLQSIITGKDLNFLKTPGEILKALVQSKQNTTSIGIRSTLLGTETMITCVEDVIIEDGQTIIILKHFDATGYILPSHRLNAQDIQAVFPFSTPFVNPFINNIDKDRTWFF